MTSGLTLLEHVWSHRNCEGWDAINHSMRTALQLAIGAHLQFEKGDITHINKKMRPSYWLGEHFWEFPYALAVSVQNKSFIDAIEAYWGRNPFFGNRVEAVSNNGYRHRNDERARERLTMWSRVRMSDGRIGRVTSMDNERVVIVVDACGIEKMPRCVLKLDHDKCRELWPAPKKPTAKKEKEASHGK